MSADEGREFPSQLDFFCQTNCVKKLKILSPETWYKVVYMFSTIPRWGIEGYNRHPSRCKSANRDAFLSILVLRVQKVSSIKT